MTQTPQTVAQSKAAEGYAVSFRITPLLRRRLQVAQAFRGVALREIVIEALEEYCVSRNIPKIPGDDKAA